MSGNTIAGKFVASPPTLTDGMQADARLSASGALIMQSVDATGNPTSGATYTLANNASLPALNSATTPVTGVAGGSYIWAYQLSGTTPSLVLETLGPDGVTYQTVATVTASGQQGIVIGTNATVRLRNNSANAITALYSSLT